MPSYPQPCGQGPSQIMGSPMVGGWAGQLGAGVRGERVGSFTTTLSGGLGPGQPLHALEPTHWREEERGVRLTTKVKRLGDRAR